MKKLLHKILPALLTFLLLLPLSPSAYAASGARSLYMVCAEEGADARIIAEKAEKRLAGFELEYMYSPTINAFAAYMTESQAALLSVSAGVSSCEPAVTVGAPYDGDAGVSKAVAESNRAVIENTSDKLDGTGTVVAVLGTGFNTESAYFTLSDPSKAKLTEDDIADKLDRLSGKGVYISEKLPFVCDYTDSEDPGNVMSAERHSMLISSVIGANSKGSGVTAEFSGAVPECQLIFMKIFSDGAAPASDDIICAAVCDAITLGADVICLFLGTDAGASDGAPMSEALYLAVKAAREAGIPVISAVSNNGRTGVSPEYLTKYGITYPLTSYVDNGTVTSPASMDCVTSVGSLYSGASYSDCIAASDGTLIPISDTNPLYGITDERGFCGKFDGLRLGYSVIGGAGTASDFESAGDVAGKIALIKRGELEFLTKIENAHAAGAAAVIIYDNGPSDETLLMNIAGAKIPAVFISLSDGELLAGKTESERYITVTTELKTVSYDEKDGTLSLFSAWGMNADMVLKPELVCYGGNVTAIDSSDNLVAANGTSLACAAAAGGFAELIQYFRENDMAYTVDILENLMCSSATPVYAYGSASDSVGGAGGIFASPRQQGAGVMNTDAAVNASAVLTGSSGVAEISLGELDIENDSVTTELYITNLTGKERIFYLAATAQGDAYVSADELPGVYFIPTQMPEAFENTSIKVGGNRCELNMYSDSSERLMLAVEANSTLRLNITFKFDSELLDTYSHVFENGFFVEGYFLLSESEDGAFLASIPYAGFFGSWADQPFIDADVYSGDESYYGGTYLYGTLTGFGSSERTEMGRNSFNSDYEYRSSLIAFSPDGDGNFDSVRLSASFLRTVESVSAAVTDKDGNTVSELDLLPDIGFKRVKAESSAELWNGKASDNEKFTMSEGIYTITITAVPSAAGAKAETMSFPVYLDITAPKAGKIYLTEVDGTKYLNVASTDNFGLQAGVMYFSGIEFDAGLYTSDVTSCYAGKARKSDTYTFVLSENTPDIVYVDLIDFAFNVTTLRISISSLG